MLPRGGRREDLPSFSDVSEIFCAARYYYSELLKSGIKIYERRDAILHAKTAVIDGVWSTICTTNLDYWSFFYNNDENAVSFSAALSQPAWRTCSKTISRNQTISSWMSGKRDLWSTESESGSPICLPSCCDKKSEWKRLLNKGQCGIPAKSYIKTVGILSSGSSPKGRNVH